MTLGQATAATMVAQAGASWREAGVLHHIWVAQQAAALVVAGER